MKFFLLVTNGRSGSHFFHSLIDNHNEIATFPGIINLKKIKSEFYKTEKMENFINCFIKDNTYFFDSRKNKNSNLHQLGKNRDEHFIVNKKKFKNKFFDLNKGNKNFEITIKNLHLSYHLISKNIKKNKIKNILIHIHNITNIIKFNKFSCEIFYSYRHPISILNSGAEAFVKSKKKNVLLPKNLEFYLSRIIKEPFFIKTNYKIHIIKLEELHLNSKKIIYKICKIFDVSFKKTLLQSTFMGKLWWGDNLTKIKKNSFNKNFKIRIRKENFYNKDYYFFQKILIAEMKKLKYKKINYSKYNFLYLLFPFKIEIMLFLKLLKNFEIINTVLIFFII